MKKIKRYLTLIIFCLLIFAVGGCLADPKPPKYNITVGTIVNGIISVDKETAEEGETIEVKVTPSKGYLLSELKYNEELINGRSFKMPAEDVEITATFVKAYTISVSDEFKDIISLSKSDTYKGDIVTLTINKDYVDFCTLLSDEVEFTKLETDGAYTFVMPEKDIIISAKLTKYEITSTSQYFEVERTAIAGETVFITMHQDYMKIYEPVISGVDLMKINDDTYIFVMPENNVSIEDRLIRYSITTSSLYTLSTNMAGYGEEVTITMKTGNVGLYKPVSTDVEITEESLGVYKFTMIASEVEIQFEKIYYSITNMATEFNATVDKETASFGEVVTITYDPTNEGVYKLYISYNGNTYGTEVLTQISENQFTFIMPKDNVEIGVE